MAKALITPDAVAAVADQLIAVGQDPTLIIVQQQLGGGSYSTVKKYLDQWKAQRETPATALPLPASLAERGQALVTQIWAEALRADDARVAQLQAEAQTQTQAARQALAEAEAVIAQHEVAAEVAQQTIAQRDAEQARLTTQIATLEQTTLTATTQADALRGEAADLRAALTAAQAQLVDQAHQAGELVALRRQLDDQAALIARLTEQPSTPGRGKARSTE